MPKFEVDIIETLQMRVEVEAESLEDAVEQVRDDITMKYMSSMQTIAT